MDSSTQPEDREQVRQRGGRVNCKVLSDIDRGRGQPCTSGPFSDAVIAMHAGKAAFEQHMQSRAMLSKELADEDAHKEMRRWQEVKEAEFEEKVAAHTTTMLMK